MNEPPHRPRDYMPSTMHGGTTLAAPNTMFNASLSGSLPPPANCPGNNCGTGILPANPVPHVETVNALIAHFRDWVMHGVAPVKEAMGFPTSPISVVLFQSRLHQPHS